MGRTLRTRAPSTQEKRKLISGFAHVTAIVVTHDGEPFVEATLAGVQNQTRAPELCLGVDTGSVDASRAKLTQGLPEDSVVLDAPGLSFGDAINEALKHLPVLEAGDETTQWLWLLHDDSAPRPDALERLLDAVEKAPSVTVAGPKQLDATRPARLLEAGLTMTSTGQRFCRVGSDEVDQGQFDSRSDSLGVNTAGMLVRRDSFERLGGFDQALPGVGDDVDLGRRMWLAGHRVIVVPDAAVEHQPDDVESVIGPKASSRAAAYARLKFAPALAVPFLAVWMMIAGLGRALGRLVAKDPRGAGTEVAAGFTGLTRLGAIARGRRNVARNRSVPAGVVKSLLASSAEVRDRRRTLREERLLPDDPDPAPSLEPQREASGGDDDFDALEEGDHPSGSATGGLIAVLVAAVVSVLGMYKLLGAPAIAGGSLLAPGTFISEAWDRATSFVQPTGLGAAAPPDPFDFLVWLVQVVTAGHAQVAGGVLWLAAMPLAALTAWLMLGAVTSSAGFRFLGALVWSLVPSLQVSLAQGRPGTVVAHVVLPLLVLALVRAVGAARTDTVGGHVPGTGKTPSWAATAAASLVALPIVASEPLLVLPLVLGSVIAASITRRARNLWWVSIPSLVMAAPLLIHAITSPRALLVQPGLPQASNPAPVWQQLLGWPVSIDMAGDVPGFDFLNSGWLWVPVVSVMAAVVLFAVLAMVSPRQAVARTWVLIGLVSLAGGVAVSRLDATVVGRETVSAYTGTFISVFVLGVLVAAGAGRQQCSVPGNGYRVVNGVFSAVLALGVLVAATVWVAPRVVPGQDTVDTLATASKVAKAQKAALPATSSDRGTGPYQERTLVLNVSDDGGLSAEVADGAGTRLEDLSAATAAAKLRGNVFLPHTTQRATTDEESNAVRSLVASLASGAELDLRGELTDLAVSSVVLHKQGNASDVLANVLDAVPGLSPVGRSAADDSWIWWVDAAAGASKQVAQSGSATARVVVLSSEDAPQQLVKNTNGRVTSQRVASGDSGRILMISERSDAGWKAELNGERLTTVDHGWAQAWKLPASGGTLSIHYSHPWSWVWLPLLALVLFVSLISIIPVPRAWRVDARSSRVYRPSVAQRRAESDSEDAAEAETAGDDKQELTAAGSGTKPSTQDGSKDSSTDTSGEERA